MADESHVVLTEDELAALRPSAREVSVEAGDIVFRRGEPGLNVYAVLDGAVELRFGEGKPPKRVGPHGLFGELAVLMKDTLRSAEAVAVGPSQILAWDVGAVQQMTAGDPRVLLEIVVRSCRYLLASEEALIADLQGRNADLERALDYLRRTREELSAKEILAQSDPLTGLYNRRCLDKQLPNFARRASEIGETLILLMGDLDGFKPINDRCGHATGDRLLVQVAGLISASIRRTDLACRMGGDEFAVILPAVDPAEARVIGDRLVTRIGTLSAEHEGEVLPMGLSLGAAVYQPGEPLHAFIARADSKLYEAKAQGGARAVWESE